MVERVSEEIVDYIALVVPDGVDDDDMMAQLEDMVIRSVHGQYTKAPKALLIQPVEWTITDDPAVVAAHQPEHDCPVCWEGNLRARRYLEERPGARLALGNVRYVEVW